MQERVFVHDHKFCFRDDRVAEFCVAALFR